MNPSSPSERGRLAENAARRHLESKGYRFLAANPRVRGGEVDLVMKDGDTVVFVEVRSGETSRSGGGSRR